MMPLSSFHSNKINKTLLVIIIAWCNMVASAQSYTGYQSSPYSGIYAIVTNPADILNHRVRADINLAGFSVAAGNNIVKFKYSQRNNDDGGISYKNPITRPGKAFVNADVFGPGVLIRLSDKNAIAITTRARVMTNVYGIDAAILNTSLPDTISNAFINHNLSLKDMTVAAHAWKEIGLTYSREFAHNTYGVWKLGVGVKYLGGISAALLHTRNLSYQLDTFYNAGAGRREGIVNNATGTISLAYTKNIDSLTANDFKSFANSSTSLGLDVGVTYEYRDEMQVYEAKYSEQTSNYVWKVGASITDIGFIRYPKQGNKRIAASFNGNSYLLDDLAPPPDSADIYQMYNYYSKIFKVNTAPGTIAMQLPTTLHLSYDRYFNKWLGVHTLFNMPLMLSKISYYDGNFNPVSVSITPRAEISWAGLYLPVSYNSVWGTQVGLSLRLGPLVIGSASLINTRFFKTKGTDAYFILRIPVFGYREYVNAIFKSSAPKFTKKQLRSLNCPSM